MAKQTIKKTTIKIRPKTNSEKSSSKNSDYRPRAANGQFAPRVK